MGHARALIGIDDAKWQQTVFERIKKEDLSVRAVELLARAKRGQPQAHASKGKVVLTFDEQQVQADLRLKFGRHTTLKRLPQGGGKIELTYHSSEELDRLLNQLGL